MRNVYYKTNFNLECPVLDIQEANDYLQEDDMTKYLLDSLRNDKVTPEEIEKVEDIYWTMTSNDTGSIVLTANDKLLPATLDKISEWVSGQCSDGLGEGFEQQPFANYEDKDGDYYDGSEEEVEPEWCMASFDWETNKYKFTQVSNPRQRLQENKGVYILKSDEFIKENLNNQEAEETKALVINKLGELGADVDGIEWITDTYFETKNGCNGSIFNSEEDAAKSVLSGDDHQNAVDFVEGAMSDEDWKSYLVGAGIGEDEANAIIDNNQWKKLVEIVVDNDGPKFFLSTFSGKVYDLDNGKLLYY
ncbi:MAG: hypothetical protein IKO56_00410 [Alphaproteobacteria bacterium]|nr:hypothetical protein [Alphaproteobacteria bacterium]